MPLIPPPAAPTQPRPVPAWRRLATSGLSLALAACAPMSPLVPAPAVAASAAVSPVAPVAIEGARGPVSAARSQQIVENLKANPGQPESILDRHLAIESAVTGSPLVADNAVTLLQDGDATYRAMFEAIAKAKHHINMETYILQDDETGRRFADALIAKRQQGLQVNVLHDSVGTIDTPAAFFDRLKAAGIRVVEYNPVNPLQAKSGWDINERDHRKLLVVDGEVAFLGGINISAVYSSGSAPKKRPKAPPPAASAASATSASADSSNEGRPWRDTDVRIEGPVVAELQKIFLDTWVRQKGEPLNTADYLPARRQARDKHVVRAIASSPDESYSAIYATLMSSIDHAEKEILITMAYFVPDAQLVGALSRAAQRGVDVRLILPRHSDAKLVLSAGRAQYGALLESGVKLYERRTVLLHAKSAVIDGVWSTVGSANLDWRSFLHNQELNAVVLGDEFGAQMQKAFARDLAQSDPVTLQAWNQRPLGERLRGWLGQLLQYWL
ncbi:phosphatidylserine/phosphatidylglycerophosphate/cardiolipin synthase family protein [Ideonella sp.]|uniref:phospholipase D-like domain-containing protein n=1 Tax=Ideonella sp. TaxID=1929293 RepID=UPI0035B2974C